MKFRIRLASLLAGLAATTLGLMPVAATTYDVDAYVYEAATVQSSGSISALGVTVTWNINITATICLWASADDQDPLTSPVEVGFCSGILNMVYHQTVCGTGNFDSGSGTLTSGDGSTDTITTLTGTMSNWVAVFNGMTSTGIPVTGRATFVPTGACGVNLTQLRAGGDWQTGTT